jgi:hypothetical protein
MLFQGKRIKSCIAKLAQDSIIVCDKIQVYFCETYVQILYISDNSLTLCYIQFMKCYKLLEVFMNCTCI